MEKQLAQDYSPRERVRFLEDNADAVEDLGYQKPLTEDQIINLKEDLTDTSIKIADITFKKSEAMRGYNEELKPLVKKQAETIGSLKNRTEYKFEECFKFIDHEAGEVGYYNKAGELVYQRSLLPDERQKTIFENMELRRSKTGTNDR